MEANCDKSLSKVHKCRFCHKVYAHKSSLSRHESSCPCKENEACSSGREKEDRKLSFWCNDTDCGCGFSSATELLKHMQQIHNHLIDTKKLSFQSFEAFLEWKEDEEIRSSARFVQRSQARAGCEAIIYYFYCNRSGFYTPRGTNMRSLKVQGTCKLNCYCTAHIKARQMNDTNVEVEYCSTHHNHLPNIAHLTLPRHVKLLIATKIQQGVSVDRILDDVRDTISYGDTPQREHLTSIRDIHNIKKAMNLSNIQKHSADPASVDVWVRQLRENEKHDPILYYKPQDEIDATGRLEKDDILLCIQTEFQRDMIVQFGDKAICMDATHGTNQYGFLLITVLVIDEFGEGLPVAWAISNRETELSLSIFLKAVHKVCGDLQPGVFMSDDAVQYWGAWKATFGVNSTKKFLCSWHVDRSWRNALARHVQDSTARAEVYAKLRVVMSETNESSLMTTVQQFISFLNADHPKFAEYMRSNYFNRLEEWCYAHRVGTLLNTNMHIEAFHRVLKYIYLNGKQNKRLDSLLYTLLKISRDKWIERLQKCTKGKVTHRLNELNSRHEKATKLIKDAVVQFLSKSSWSVNYRSDSSTTYIIEKKQENCTCSLKCSVCAVCPHLLACSCIDYAVHSTACKHIHLVCIFNEDLVTSTLSPPSNEHTSVQVSEPYLSSVHNPELDKVNHLRKKIATKVYTIQLLANSSDSSKALTAAIDHLNSAELILTSQKELEGNSVNTPIPPNTNIATQRYKSTRKKRARKSAHMLLKPTRDEIKRIKLDLSTTPIKTCSICFREDLPSDAITHHETNDDSDVINWVACSYCPLWFHAFCLGDFDLSQELICFVCKKSKQ